MKKSSRDKKRDIFRTIISIFTIMILLLQAFRILFVHTCRLTTGGETGIHKTCDCQGHELSLYHRLSADGYMETVCVGIIKSAHCYEFENFKQTEFPCP